jgi:glycosyltransferase involved in cell wall biosynthesis
MKKVLIITYYWPPGSGAGVQRWLKFVKYLPQYGWEPVVLTVDPNCAAYPVTDQSLEKDILPGTRIIRTKATNYFTIFRKNKTELPSAGFALGDEKSFKGMVLRFIRGNFFIPDPRRGWNRYAFKKACEIITNEGVGHVISTSPPHSTQLIGLKLKRRFPGIKWIADLRDPWTDIYYYKKFYHTLPAAVADRYFERAVLISADKIITVGESLKGSFASKTEGIRDKITVITNGFDEDDFAGFKPVKPDRFTITYTGTLSELYPIDGFLKSICSLQKKAIEIDFRIIGLLPESIKNKIRSFLKDGSYEILDYVTHEKAISQMINSSMLLLIIPEHTSSKMILTGKLFEYIAAGKRIICLGPPDGDAAKILKSNNYGETFLHNDNIGIEKYISESIHHSLDNIIGNELFSRRYLTGKLVNLL